MKFKDYKEQVKKQMGWKWYWTKFTLLFNFDHQHDMYLMRKYRHHIQKARHYAKKIAALNED